MISDYPAPHRSGKLEVDPPPAVDAMIRDFAQAATPFMHERYGFGFLDGGCLIFAAALRRIAPRSMGISKISAQIIAPPKRRHVDSFPDHALNLLIARRAKFADHVVGRWGYGKHYVFVDALGVSTEQALLRRASENEKHKVVGSFDYRIESLGLGERPKNFIHDLGLINELTRLAARDFPLLLELLRAPPPIPWM